MADILTGISGGRWGEPVEAVRALPYKSAEQQEAKKALTYWTPSGLFRHRSNAGLMRHSGHVAIDLDDLGEHGATRAIQAAVEDRHCKCAFRSVTAQGVRLIFGCPACGALAHKRMFARIADHVRTHYRAEPDLSGSDVARASFVSLDKGIWINPSAVMLPDLAALAQLHTRTGSLCVVGERGLEQGDRETLAWGLGESRAPRVLRPDGTLATHESLRDLARDLVVRYAKHGLTLSQTDIERAFVAWWDTGRRTGRFRLRREDYLAELSKAIGSVQRVPWLSRVVSLWLRWTHEPDFPRLGSSAERLEYAIGRHCAESRTNRFYLSARDAATITGTTFRAANDTLHRLVAAAFIQRAGKRLHARHAQEYTLRSGP